MADQHLGLQGLGQRSQRVVRCDAVHEADISQRAHRVQAGGECRGRGLAAYPDGEVGPSRQQGVPAAIEHLVREAQPGRRVQSIKIFEQRAQPLERNNPVQRDAQFDFPAAGNLLDPADEIVGGAHQQAALLEQFFARGGQMGTLAAPVEDQDVELVFETAHCVGERGGDLAQFGGRRGKTAAPRDRVQDRQGIEREGHIQIL